MDLKTIVMIVGLAAATGAVTACFSLSSKETKSSPPLEESCEGLEGRPKLDCEARASKKS